MKHLIHNIIFYSKTFLVIVTLQMTMHATMSAQSGSCTISGIVSASGKPLSYANIGLEGTPFGTIAGLDGHYAITGIPPGKYVLQVTYLGYKTWIRSVFLESQGQELIINPELIEAPLMLNELVVTGTRSEKRQLDSAVPVNILDSRILLATQSSNLSEGLSFQPGLRIEKDCQTCNFTQVRMNGMGGSYTQILLNSKPLFSALAGLYGLEQFPASLIERVEIVRGGGSVLYGSNAIAGTINIITKNPKETSLELANTFSLVDGKGSDIQTDFNGSLVSKSKKYGGTLIVSHREREPWDANADGFSELSQLKNLSLGLATFIEFSKDARIRFSLNNINEIRNGGDQLNRKPHLRMQSEYRDAKILAGNVDFSYDIFGMRTKLDCYAGAQETKREHYTGAFGADGYGDSDNNTYTGGVQLSHKLLNFITGSNTLTAGIDYQQDYVFDEIIAYNYLVNQQTYQSGVFLQSDWELHRKINLISGIRLSTHNKTSGIFTTPRVNLLYKISSKSQLRFSYATGFRPPQAFDTDLHIAFAGGGVAITKIDPALKSENSVSYTASYDFNYPRQKYIYGITITGFKTQLKNTFILIPDADDTSSSNSTLLRTNGSDAQVNGITVEARVNYNYKFEVDLGYTFQNSIYKDKLVWSEHTVPMRKFLRTPAHYGYFVLTHTAMKSLKTSISGIYTGSMVVLHLAGAPGVNTNHFLTTPSFLELNFKIEYQIISKNLLKSYLYIGIQNFTNSFQSDFDIGPSRDSNYIYGPGRPRTYFLGFRIQALGN